MEEILNHLKECVPETHFRVWKNPFFRELDSKFPHETQKVIFVIVNQYQMIAFIKTEESKYIHLRFYYEAHCYTSGQILNNVSIEKSLEIFESIKFEPLKWNYLKFTKHGFEYLNQNPDFFENYNSNHLKVMGKIFKTDNFKEYIKSLK